MNDFDLGQSNKFVNLIYILMLIGIPSAGLISIAAVVLAHAKSGQVPALQQTHIDYQIRTFWYGVVLTLVGYITIFMLGVGILVLLFVPVWVLVRCIKGIIAINGGQEIVQPDTWLW